MNTYQFWTIFYEEMIIGTLAVFTNVSEIILKNIFKNFKSFYVNLCLKT